MKLFLRFSLGCCLFLFCYCSNPEVPAELPLKQSAESELGMVSASHPMAVLAGKEILEAGGNAADAAVATGFALAVVEPSMSGLGGRLQALLRKPNGELHGIDATTQAPIGYEADTSKVYRYGYQVIGIPGVVAGLTKILEEHGTMGLTEVMAPAIRFAAEGFPLEEDQAMWHDRSRDQLLEFPGSRRYFLKSDSSPYKAGEILVQKDLAKTLMLIAEQGKSAFYTGEIAEKMVADIQANGGYLNMESLANYEARDAKILTGDYREHQVNALWLPSFGAITIEILHILENLPMEEMDDEDWATAFYLAINRAYEDRRLQNKLGDTLLQKTYAAKLANELKSTMDNQQTSMLWDEDPESWVATNGHTTHLSVADKDGMVIALTQSLGPLMGSKVATEDLGFLYAVTLGPYLRVTKAGERAASHISPTIISKDDKPYLVIGAAGGSRIVSAIVEVTSRFIDQKKSLPDAVAAPRVHPILDTIYLETHEGTNWSEGTVQRMENAGYAVRPISEPFRFGRVHAIYFDAQNGKWIGAADPDGAGKAAGPSAIN